MLHDCMRGCRGILRQQIIWRGWATWDFVWAAIMHGGLEVQVAPKPPDDRDVIAASVALSSLPNLILR